MTIKRIPKEKVAILHVCSQKEQIERLIKNTDKLSNILIGNGNPKEGYVYKVIEMGNKIKEIKDHLTGISGIVKDLHEEVIGRNKVDKTDAEKRAEKRAEYAKWFQIGMFIIATIALLYTAYNTHENIQVSKTNMTKIDNLGDPVITNPRGETVGLPDGYKLRMYPKDFLKDTIK